MNRSPAATLVIRVPERFSIIAMTSLSSEEWQSRIQLIKRREILQD